MQDEGLNSFCQDDLCNLLAGGAAFGAGPQGVDVPHLLGHMQTRVDACGFHLVAGLDHIGIEYLPGTCEKVGRRKAPHVAIKGGINDALDLLRSLKDG